MKRLMEEYDNYALSISVTTRDPRPGEEDGVSYFFRTEEEFDRMVEEDAFLEYARYVKHSYGTPKAYVEEQLDAGKDVLLDDGVFEVTLIKKPKNPMELNEIIASLINLVDDTDMIYSFKTAEVKFTASREIPWTLDGEFGGDHEEVCVKNLKQAVDIMVKKPEESKI